MTIKQKKYEKAKAAYALAWAKFMGRDLCDPEFKALREATVKAEEGKPADPARVAQLQEAYEKWKDSYVTKCNKGALLRPANTCKV